MLFAKRLSVFFSFCQICLLALLALGSARGSVSLDDTKISGVVEPPPSPPPSLFFAAGVEEPYSSYQMHGDGDLWPSCWADDDNLYTANGDGSAFTGAKTRPDLLVSRISGMPPNLTGTPLASDVGTNWSGAGFNRKPTGMLCVHGVLYLAFQNLDDVGFNSAPAASVAKSSDHGATWHWDTSAPMFGGPGKAPLFTTLFFLDFGKDSRQAIDKYVYVYGLDKNWRSQQELYLARVRASHVEQRDKWEFYQGMDQKGHPLWTREIKDKQPVLVDRRMVRPVVAGPKCPAEDAVIAQGGVVYDKPLKRYLFSSWSCSTHEFYEAPTPWGPWKHVLSHDFGATLSPYSRGQYGTTVPSKFISPDGTRFMLQSNVCCSGDSYTFALRGVQLEVSRRTGLEKSGGRDSRSLFAPASWIGFRRSERPVPSDRPTELGLVHPGS